MKRMYWYFYNSFTNEFLGSMEINYDPLKAINGHYSNFWKTMKIGLANLNKIDKHWVRLKFKCSI